MRSWSLKRPDGVVLVGESRGQGEPVVLVHPTGMTRRGLAAAADHLAPHLRAVTYDRRGWGDSRGTPAPQRWWASHGDDLIAVIESMGEAAEVVAWAGSCAAAIHAALRRPDLVRQLVLFEPTIGAGPPRARRLRHLRRALTAAAAGDHRRSRAVFWRATTRRGTWSLQAGSRGLVCAFDHVRSDIRELLLDAPGPLAEELRAGTEDELLERLAELRPEVHILLGGTSVRPVYRIADRWVERCPSAGFRGEDDCDALLPLNRPRVFAACVLEMLGYADWRAIAAARLAELREVLRLPALERLRARCVRNSEVFMPHVVSATPRWAAELEAGSASLLVGSTYEVTGAGARSFGVIDECGEDYGYPPGWFEPVPIDWQER
ncbi:alpha/beta fold hydrolase [Nannocystis bainbridge]|uniref:Alpha/beta hydrolase n=1 Tax=Nannocystis bainbridge TaxID=2995303 RepID=A0ABT5E9A3_9BACT|nr:alpha/beta hydrolase [Nannocystis bainbridge]MDC0722437.1 alpha/beta hydrolase [Nannocystis bainbridge]